MVALVLYVIVFVAASYFIRRYLDRAGVPKSPARNAVIFALGLASAYGFAFLVDWVVY